jgi:hypothetical protein
MSRNITAACVAAGLLLSGCGGGTHIVPKAPGGPTSQGRRVEPPQQRCPFSTTWNPLSRMCECAWGRYWNPGNQDCESPDPLHENAQTTPHARRFNA